jgi:type I restriction enzyme S subunit
MNDRVPLGEVAVIDSGIAFPNALQGRTAGDVPFAKVGDISTAAAAGSGVISSARNYVSKDIVQRLRARPFPEGAIVFAKIGEAIRLNNRAITTRPMLFDNNVMGIAPDTQRVDTLYLFYFLKTIDFYSFANTTAVPSIRKTDLADIAIPLPELSRQRAIANQLRKADDLCRTRRHALQLSDEFLPAAFLEMFGDPIKNPKNWPLVELGCELDTIESGYSPVCEGRRTSPDEWAVLALGAVTWGRFDPTANKRLPPHETPRVELEVKHQDLLVTRKNTYDLVAASALVTNPPPRLLLPDTVFRFQLRKGAALSKPYLWALLSYPSFKAKVQRLAAGSSGSMPGISKEKLQTVLCPVPPVEQQQMFARILAAETSRRQAAVEALRQTDHLFQTLLHEAFA